MQEETGTPGMGTVERVLADGEFQVSIDGTMRVCHIGSMLRRVGAEIREGDRVAIGAAVDGVAGDEITQVRPPLALPRAVPQRAASLVSRAAPTLRPGDQRIDGTAHPGWLTGEARLPVPGDTVHCVGGVGTVLRVLGKTGNGSRLLEIQLPGQPRVSYFAAASNVLIEPMGREDVLVSGDCGRG